VRPIPFGRPWITEDDRQAVMEVLNGPTLAHGPKARVLEAEFAAFVGAGAHCVSVSSGMAALHLAYLHFGIGPGDEVIVPAQTHVATVHAVEVVGARPVFVDADPATGNLTPDAIAVAVTARTRAVSVVHFLGIPCEMEGIVAVAERHRLRVIEDCALAVGSRLGGRHVGLFGDVGCFSFYPVKHITTAEGGMFLTRHADVAEAVGKLRAFGVDRSHTERTLPGMYDVPQLGLNYRMSEVHAALGLGQVRRLHDNLARRRAHFDILKSALAGQPHVHILDAQTPREESSHYCLSLVLQGRLAHRRDALVKRLNACGIGTSVYYPHPVPRLQYYQRKYGDPGDGFPHASAISDGSVALPVGPHLDPDDLHFMAEQLKLALTEVIS
jgi:dTDP-4-amino-4,6-dideoxygalactose transaminase